MDTEQLRMILEIIREAGAGTKDVAILYMAVSPIKSILAVAGILGGIHLICSGIKEIIKQVDDYCKSWKTICDFLGDENAGYNPNRHDVERIIKRIKEYNKPKEQHVVP